jgi:FG-GAP-like repeat
MLPFPSRFQQEFLCCQRASIRFGSHEQFKPRFPSFLRFRDHSGGFIMSSLSVRLCLAVTVICLLIPSSLMASFPKPLPTFPAGPSPAGVAIGDFNGDGKLDLVLVNQDHFTITVVRGRGDGTFRDPITSTDTCVAAATGPVFAGDFNGDHKLDIAFSGGNGFCVALGNGDGTFGSIVNYPDPGGEPIGIGDLNGDKKLDVVFLRQTNLTFFLDLFLGNGDGTFRVSTSSLAANSACTLADVNGDGKLDLVGGKVQLGNGDGTFQAPIPVPGTGFCPAIADFNGDGKLDLAILAKNGVSLLFGNGNGTFQAPVTNQLGIDMSNVGSAGDLMAADFNGDSKPDLFVKNGTILLNSGSGKFSYAGAASYPLGGFLGDFNSDGRTDVVSVFEGKGSQLFARIALTAPDGTLPLPRAYFLEETFGGPYIFMAAGDFNSDGKLDLAAVSTQLFGWDTGELSVLLAKRAGIFQPPLASITGDADTNFVATADLNHDGKLDLVMASGGNSSPPDSIPTTGSVNVRLGRGDGTFQKPVSYPGVLPSAIAIGDFNEDGIPDIAVNSRNEFGIFPGQILLGNGDGTFRSGPSLPPGIQSLVAADFNHDGKIDLAVGMSGGVGTMLGNGDGTFHPLSVIHNGQFKSLVIADFNNDGVLDVAGVGGTTSGTVVSVYLGNGKGAISWAHNSLISTVSGVFSVAAVADFDGDGTADIAITGNGVAVGRGKGTGYFQPAFFYPIGVGLVAADLDGDGTPDLAVTAGNKVVVLLNKP